MRQLPPWIWLMLAAVFGIIASVAWIKHQGVQPAPIESQTVAALIVKRDIAQATRLGADMIAATAWSRENFPKGAFINAAELEGRVTAFPMVEGELILEKKLAPKGTVPGLTALLSVNMRAMTVKVDEASGVAGFVAPENRVDVLVTVDKGEYNKDPISRVMLQNIRVLGTGQRIETRPGDKPQVVPTVTLEVSPAEGERLALATQAGHISLVLRGQDDGQLVSTQGASAGSLFGPVANVPPANFPPAVVEPKPPTPAPARHISEIIRGLQREPVTF
jgi:pilus assembly protein CpaB